MPPLLGALISGFAAGLAIGPWAGVWIGALTLISNTLLAPKTPKLKEDLAGTTLQKKEPAEPWKIVYGQAQISGNTTLMELSYASSILHMVLTIAGHECESIDSIIINEHFHWYTGLTSDYFEDNYICTAGEMAKSYKRSSYKYG